MSHLFVDSSDVREDVGVLVGLLWASRDEGLEFGLAIEPFGFDARTLETDQLAAGPFFNVGEGFGASRMLDRHRSVGGAGRFHFSNLPCVQVDDGRKSNIGFVAYETRGAIAHGSAGVSEQKHRIVFLDALRVQANESFGVIRDILCRILGGFAIGACVGSHEREVPGVARPLPVVEFTTKGSDGDRGRKDEANIFEVRVEK